MIKQQLLTEGFVFGGATIIAPDQLTESDKKVMQKYGRKNTSNPVLVGICQMADVENGNKRTYPRAILEREIERYKKIIEAGRAVGECDHPESSEINLKNVSHKLIDIWWEGDKVMCKTMVLDNPKLPAGQIAAGLIEEGIVLGLSSRALGSIKEDYNGSSIVEDDLNLICFDLVSEPSTPGAYQYRQGAEAYQRRNRAPADFSNRINPQEQRELNSYLNKESKINDIINDILKG